MSNVYLFQVILELNQDFASKLFVLYSDVQSREVPLYLYSLLRVLLAQRTSKQARHGLLSKHPEFDRHLRLIILLKMVLSA
jgi:hypothetical protein